MKKETLKNGFKVALLAGGVFALVPAVYGQGIGLQTLETMTAGTPQQIERGESVYQSQCVTCHGEDGAGGAELGQRLGADGFVDTEVERSGVMSIYSVISHGYEYPDGQEHPVFENLFYQDRWAVSHYVHSLIDDPEPAPESVVERIEREAREGICDPEIRAGITEFIEPESEEQIAQGEELYTANGCNVCHGAEGEGDGPGAGTDPPARDFTAPPEEWTNGTSPLALFNTLDQGIEGTAMPSFGHLPEEELWAMVHFLRTEFIPDEHHEDLTEEQIDEVCRSLSAPPRPEPIPIEKAMEFLAHDADERRFLRQDQYGDPIVAETADIDQGQELYSDSCASCHGDNGEAVQTIGPYGSFPPYLQYRPHELAPAAVGGTYVEVAQRVIEGPHATLPNMTSVASFSQSDWRDVQAYISSFDGEGQDRVRTINYDNPDEADLSELENDMARRIIENIEDPEQREQLLEAIAEEEADVDEDGEEVDEDGEEIGDDAEDTDDDPGEENGVEERGVDTEQELDEPEEEPDEQQE